MDTKTPASRLKTAREAVRLSQQDVADLTGINSSWYYDLEAYEDELASTMSLEELCHLADVVRADPLVLLLGDRARSVERSVQFDEVVRSLVAQTAAANLSVQQFGERVGWELTEVMADPQELWKLSTDGFVDIAKAAGLEWTSAFPRARRPGT